MNLRRAPAIVVEQACRKALPRSTVQALLTARDRAPYRELPTILNESDELQELSEQQRKNIRQHVTTRSTCHGLWVIARTERRSWHTLSIGISGEGKSTIPARDFAW